MVTAETYFKCFIHVRQDPVIPIEKSPSLVLTTQERDNVTIPCYSVYALLSVKWWVKGGIKKRGKFPQNFSSKSGLGRLREVVAYKRL